MPDDRRYDGTAERFFPKGDFSAAGPQQTGSDSWYDTPPPDEQLDALQDRRAAEIERGVTLVGPHRDDLALALGDLPAKGYASHGESWSFALALRLAAYDLLRSDGIEPVLVPLATRRRRASAETAASRSGSGV